MAEALYIHIPFCKSKCFYCSFASWANRTDLIGPYLEALKKEAATFSPVALKTIYIGGGTPTILSVPQLKTLFDIIAKYFTVQPSAEVTIEANPETFDLAQAQFFKTLGANRVSLGIQSLDDQTLQWLGRSHSRADALKAFEALRHAGFKNLNVDLMYALPEQSDEALVRDVRALIALGSEHISLYSFTVSQGSGFFQKDIKEADEETQVRQFKIIIDELQAVGYDHYEISNFAKPGFICRHNLAAWQGDNYIGLGASAHSHEDGRRWWNVSDPEVYIAKIKTSVSAKEDEEILRAQKRLMETLLIGLRLTQGVCVERLEARLGMKLSLEKQQTIEEFIRQKFLIREGGFLKTTLSGMLVLDELSARLI